MSRHWFAIGLCVIGIGACSPDSTPQTPDRAGDAPAQSAGADAPPGQGAEAGPIPLRIPINSVMAGVVNRASFDIFQANTAPNELSEQDWLRVGAAAIDLVGAATLTTIPGTGDNDAAWVAEPDWLKYSIEMRDSAMAVGRAASTQDRAALSEGSARLAQSCQSCHLIYSPRLVRSTTP